MLGSNLSVVKTFKFDTHESGFDVTCRLDLVRSGTDLAGRDATSFTVGVEIVLNMLAPDVPDRFFEFSGIRQPLRWSGIVEGSRVRVADEWQNVAVEIDAHGANQLWFAPIETVSESEEGFERVYQGSQILGVWEVDFASSEKWSAETVLHVKPNSRCRDCKPVIWERF